MNKTENTTFTFKTMNIINRFKILIVPVLILLIIIYLNTGVAFSPVEEIDVVTGYGCDIEEISKDNILYKISLSNHIFKEDKTFSNVIDGTGKTIIATRDERQRKSNKKFVAGLEKIIIFSEDFARYSIRNVINTTFANPHANDKIWVIVCKGKAIDLLKFKVIGYPSSADYIEGIIENSKSLNFFPQNYRLIDSYVRIDEEGRELVAPYIEIKNDNIEITGMALFKKDKMVTKVGLEDAKILNILKEKKSKGTLSIEENPKQSIDYITEVKRTATCNKIEDKYTFTIDLDFTGDIMCNELYGDFLDKPGENKKFRSDMEKKLKKMCYIFLEKMQKDYKLDCLELGRVAAATYGRNTGVDWNEIVSNSDIKVNVKVNIDRYGRGNF
ncbi:Ger(x)C family spore germination protein [Clostridium sp. ZS2-4]|uniref:Ger(x)C family spore germination protein n=1 Tax=Clostridium sp. ZS2-4 TaxID=2987703 RepID=UPI00227CC9AD|nr:Ger(x)C family spore germination protein [Clostridium sp. ZS2-4]MCY6355251.1 Ger(x)C family spore germination protein [Clostridium sp. ZS2-4]